MNDDLRRELERLALDRATSGRGKLAKIEALRLLERLDREADSDEFPTDDEGRFHPGSPGWWGLDRHDSDENVATAKSWFRASRPDA